MAHRALTLKYRPQVFSDLIGQDHVSSVIARALESGRVAHAFLFTGARGVGKTTSARLLAKSLNCANRKPGSPDPCNACDQCTEITGGVSLDVVEIDGASNRGIDDVQSLREKVRFAPTSGRYRIVIIDEVHQLSKDAFAALLKTLEEPPAHLVFIFATTDPQKLPDTIRSRTQRFDFARVALRKVADRLIEIQRREAADPEGTRFQLTDGAALLIAHKGEGSMRDSVSALDQVVSAGEPEVNEDLVRRVLGIADREVFFRLGEAILARDPRGTLTALHASFEKGLDPRELAEGLTEHVRDIMVVQLDPEKATELVALSSEDIERLRLQGQGWAETDLLRLVRIATEVQWPMRDSAQPLVHLEAAVLQMATLEPAESMAVLLTRLEALEARLTGGAPASGRAPGAPSGAGAAPRTATPHRGASMAPPAAAPPRAPAASLPRTAAAPPAAAPRSMSAPPRASAATSTSAPASTGPATTAAAVADTALELDDAVTECWSKAIGSVNPRKRMLGAFLEECQFQGVAGSAAHLAMDSLHQAVIDAPEHRTMIQDALTVAFGRTMTLKCVPLAPGQGPKVRTEADVRPMLDKAREFFDGEPIDRRGPKGDR